jgi:hypothetical protein
MAAIFCLRLAVGLIAALALLSPAQVNPRFYRAQLWIALGLSVAAGVFVRHTANAILWAALASSVVLAFAGSMVWALEGAPCGRTLIALTGLALTINLGLAEWNRDDAGEFSRRLAGDTASAALLGTAMTAMLLGHFYLIAPGMSLTPLLRLLAALAAAVVLRMAVAGLGLWSWTAEHSLTNLSDATVLWLPLRWLLGFVGPLVLAWMAWQTTRVRSTQSATGILYVTVIFCFLGELTGQLLWSNTGVLL